MARIGFLAGAVLSVAWLVTSCTTDPGPYDTAAHSAAPDVQPFANLLTTTADPVDILLVGDGTGTSLGGWAFLSMQALSERYGRPAAIYDWDFGSGRGYLQPPVEVAPGDGAAITLWNASVSRNVDYLRSALPGMTPPSAVDLVIVNNGLDMGANTLAAESIPLMRELAKSYPDAAVVALLQPAPPDHREVITANTRDLDISARKNDFQVIDVGDAFNDYPQAYDENDRYPNPDGQRLWATTVTDALIWEIDVPAA